MPRSSRHKSSKHSSRDVREYSDSEKESGLRERKVKGDGVSSSSGRHLKESISGEKHKVDLKHVDVSKKSIGLGNADEFGGGVAVVSSSRKRKEKVDDDRWAGGDDDVEHVVSKSEMKEKEDVKGLGESRRSSRRGGNYVSGFDVEDGRKSGSRDESKHYRSERKERGEKEAGSERERKSSRSDKSEKLADIVMVSENLGSKGNKKLIGSGEDRGGRRSAGKTDKVISEKLIDIVSVGENTGSDGNRKPSGSAEERGGKHSIGYTDFSIQKELKILEPERDLDRRVRRKRDGSGDGDTHHAARDSDDRRLPSREETTKSVKYKDDVHKDDGHKDEKNKDRYHEDTEKDNWRQDDKHRDNRSSRDYSSGKFDDKDLRNDKKDLDLSQKKSLPHSSEYDRELDRDYDRIRVRDRDRDRDRTRLDNDRSREHGDRDYDRDRDRDYDRVHDREQVDRDREHGADRYRRELRGRVGVRDPDRRDRNFDHDHDNEYTLHSGEKSSRYKDDRLRRRSPDGYEDFHSDKLRRGKAEVDKEMPLPQKPIVDTVVSSNQRRSSPNSRAYIGGDKFRDGIQDETKYGDSLRDSTIPEPVDRAPNYRSGEKRAKLDDGLTGEFSERSPNTRVSPAGLRDRSPSSMSYDRSRFSNRNTRRRSLDVDDPERRISDPNDRRDDINVTVDRQSLPPKKFSGDDYPSAESPYYHKNKSGPGSGPSHGPGPSVFRTRVDSPSFAGSYGDDNRGPGNRYRRNVDPNAGRGPGNAWNGVPNWPSPIANGYIPFSPGPIVPNHGGFPPFLPQYHPMYGVRPSVDMNHQGIPYHLADGDRFPGQVRPMGWPNMGDGSMPPHFNGWDASNGMLRDDPSMYGPGHLAQRRDMNSDMWKQNGDVNMDVISGSQRDGPTIKGSADAESSAHGFSKLNASSGQSPMKDASSGQSPMKEMPSTPAKGTTDKTPDSSGVDDKAKLLRAYLAKLDISMDLTDPELYNQCINLAYNGKPECVEDEPENEFMEENAVVETQITRFSVHMKIFPTAKESIFQKAMDLYKAQSSERSSVIPDLQKINSPTPSPPDKEQTLSLEESIDGPADTDVKLEEQTLVLPEETVPITLEGATCVETPNTEPLQNCDIFPDVETDAQLPVLDVEKMEEPSTEIIPDNVENLDSSVENTCVDAVISNTDADILLIDGGKVVSGDSITVSSPLNLCNDDSVKVSNESESPVLSRIHHDAPESTH